MASMLLRSYVIDSGTYKVSESVEGLEGKSITINGDITIYATDDGVNAANTNASKMDQFPSPWVLETTNVEVGQGDTIQVIRMEISLYRRNQ